MNVVLHIGVPVLCKCKKDLPYAFTRRTSHLFSLRLSVLIAGLNNTTLPSVCCFPSDSLVCHYTQQPAFVADSYMEISERSEVRTSLN